MGFIDAMRAEGHAVESICRVLRVLGLEGVRRDKGVRTTTPGKDGIRAGDLRNRDFSYSAQFRVMCRWAGRVYVAFCCSVPVDSKSAAADIPAWNLCLVTDM